MTIFTHIAVVYVLAVDSKMFTLYEVDGVAESHVK